MTLTKTTNHVAEALDHLAEQFKGKSKIEAFLTAFASQIQDLEDAGFEMYLDRWIATSEGIQLDGLGAIVGEDREGRGDEEYRLAILAQIQINFSEATPEDILLALTNFYRAIYQMVELGYADFIVRFVGIWTEGIDPATEDFVDLLNKVNGAGIEAWFQWSEYDDDSTFTFASGDVEEASTTQGFGQDPIWVAVSTNGTNRTMKSVDRKTWTAVAASELAPWRDVVFSPRLGQFIAFNNTGTDRAMYSDDGTSWSGITIALEGWYSAVWSAELRYLVAVASGASTVYDGTSWTDHTMPTGQWNSIAWSPSLELFVAVSGGTKIATSPDGKTWTERDPGGGLADIWESVTWSEEMRVFVVVVDSAASYRVYTSSDGITWVGRTAPARDWKAVVWSDHHRIFVAVGANPDYVITSLDGVTWTEYSMGIASTGWNALAEFGGLFVAVSGSGKVGYSDNGIHWTEITPPESNNWSAVTFGAPTGGIMSEIIGG